MRTSARQIDNRGNRFLLKEEASLNVPAIAAARVVKRYTAQASDEISIEVHALFVSGTETLADYRYVEHTAPYIRLNEAFLFALFFFSSVADILFLAVRLALVLV